MAETAVSPLVARQKSDVARNTFDPTLIPASFSSAMDSAIAENPNAVVILDAWEKLNQDKTPLIDRSIVISYVKFMTDKETGANYVNMWVVRDDDRLYRVTDGSTGIYDQMSAKVAELLAADDPHPYGPFVFPNGLRVSEYGLDKNNKPVPLGDPSAVSKGATYYLQ